MPEMASEYSNQRVPCTYTKENSMQITYHAAERFLQRVFRFASYSKEQVSNAKQLLERDLYNLQLREKRRVVLPSFPNFYGVFVSNTLVTVIPKRLNASL